MKKCVCRCVGEENGKDLLFMLVQTKIQNTTKMQIFHVSSFFGFLMCDVAKNLIM